MIDAFSRIGPDCRLLITTRNAEVLRRAGAREYHVNFLPLNAALRLLAKSSGSERLPALAHDVARGCGFLPLALTIVGALIRSGHYDWASMLERLTTADPAGLNATLPDYEHTSVAKAIQISLDALPNHVRTAFLDCAVFLEDVGVPEETLCTLWADRFTNHLAARDAIHLIVDRSLMSRDADRRYRLHDLLRDHLRAKVGDINLLHDRLIAAYKAQASDGWESIPDDGYFFHNFPRHLHLAGHFETLRLLLLNFRWMQAKLRATSIDGLLTDLIMLEGDSAATPLRRALLLSAQTIARDPSQLAAHLVGRLSKIKDPAIQQLLSQISDNVEKPWLRPLTGSLAPPTGRLLLTIFAAGELTATALAITPNGHLALSGDKSGTLTFCDLHLGQIIRTVKAHSDPIDQIVLSSNGRWAMSCSSREVFTIWNTNEGVPIRTFTGSLTVRLIRSIRHAALRLLRVHAPQKTAAVSMAISDDGAIAVIGRRSGIAEAWSVNSGHRFAHVRVTPSLLQVILVEDGRSAMLLSRPSVEPPTLQMTNWKLLENQVDSLPEANAPFGILTGNPRHLLLIGKEIAWVSEFDREKWTAKKNEGRENEIKNWSQISDTVSEIRSNAPYDVMEKHRIQSWSVSRNGKFIVFMTSVDGLHVYDLTTGKRILRDIGLSPFNRVAVTENGHYVVLADERGDLRVLDCFHEGQGNRPDGHEDRVTSMVVIDRGGLFCGTGNGQIGLWNLQFGTLIQTLDSSNNTAIRHLVATPDGDNIAALHNDGIVILRRSRALLSQRKLQLGPIRRKNTVGTLSLTVRGMRTYLIGATDEGIIHVWTPGHDRRQYNVIERRTKIPNPAGPPHALRVLRDGLAAGAWLDAIHIEDPVYAQPVIVLRDAVAADLNTLEITADKSLAVCRVEGSVLHGCAGWRKGRPVLMLRISPSCRTNTMPTVATIFLGRSDA